MLIKNIGAVSSIPICQILKETKLWESDVLELSKLQITAAYNVLKINYGRDKASEALRALTDEAINEYVIGDLPVCELLTYVPPSPMMTSDKAVRYLNTFQQEELRAIMFSLFSGMSLRKAILLLHGELDAIRNTEALTYSDGVQHILKSQPRHMKLKYVFWRFNVKSEPMPLLDLEAKFTSVTGMLWSEFESQIYTLINYGDLIPYLEQKTANY